MKLVLAREAVVDLARVREFLDDKNPSAAQRVAAVLSKAMQSLEAFPIADGLLRLQGYAN